MLIQPGVRGLEMIPYRLLSFTTAKQLGIVLVAPTSSREDRSGMGNDHVRL